MSKTPSPSKKTPRSYNTALTTTELAMTRGDYWRHVEEYGRSPYDAPSTYRNPRPHGPHHPAAQ